MTVPVAKSNDCNIGIMNLSDLPSRGCSANELVKYKWWQGSYGLKIPLKKGEKAEATAAAFPIQPEEAASACFPERTKDSVHGERISYDHLPNATENLDQLSTNPNVSGRERRVSINLSTVNGKRVLKNESHHHLFTTSHLFFL
ncbi:hypothetical protein NPIL_549721 [Nephila pilipes]|uniref:Uncharacterized protein n=1 Tax=Nephila pilipes TaxID=299642 RepID=A0A8X6N369_NEPPI|nr:hypothetical protein NPIL_549721 [Nephila pilipes]